MATSAAKAPARKPAAKNKPGRPTKWRDEYMEQARKLALLGLTDAEMADVWGINESTLHLWKQTVPGFSESITRGKVLADADVAASLYERACGYSHPDLVITSYQGEITETPVTKHYPPDTQAASLWLRNRKSGLWRSQPDPTDDPDAPPPVKVVVEVKDARKRPDDAVAQPAAG